MTLLLLVAAAGGLGAVSRVLVDAALQARHVLRFPAGTFAINITGSFLLGLLSGLGLQQAVSPAFHHVVGAGFLGGYTTFSAASVETVRLLRERRTLAGLVNGLGQLAAAAVAAAAGLLIGMTA